MSKVCLYMSVGGRKMSYVIKSRLRPDGGRSAPFEVREHDISPYMRKCTRTTKVCPTCRRGPNKTDCLACGGTGSVPWSPSDDYNDQQDEEIAR